jgi:hypothetical protein
VPEVVIEFLCFIDVQVDKVGIIRKTFIDEGLMTIEITKPQVNIMIRQSEESKLRVLLDKIDQAKEEFKEARRRKTELQLDAFEEVKRRKSSAVAAASAGTSSSEASTSQGPSSRKPSSMGASKAESKAPATSTAASQKVKVQPEEGRPVCNAQTSGESEYIVKVINSSEIAILSVILTKFLSYVEVLAMLFSQVAKKSLQVNPTLQQTRLCFPTVVKPEPKENSSKRKLDSTESLLPNDLRNNFGSDVKKPRSSQVVSKKEVEALMQTMKRDKGRMKLKITARENYPSSFPSTLHTLIISGIKLKKVDKHFTILQNLTVLELCNNSLTDVDRVSSPFWRTVSVMKMWTQETNWHSNYLVNESEVPDSSAEAVEQLHRKVAWGFLHRIQGTQIVGD